MNARQAKQRAYGIAAETLRKGMESDLIADLVDDDYDRLWFACCDLIREFRQRSGEVTEENDK